MNNEKVSELLLLDGQQIRLGDVVMQLDATEMPTAPAPEPKKFGIRIAGHEPAANAAAPAAAEAVTETTSNVPSGPLFCKYHPKSPATRWCTKCQKSFCSLCVTQLCKTCGTTCTVIDNEIAYAVAEEPSFYQQLPGILAYPFLGNGKWMLAIGTVLYVLVSFAAMFSGKVWMLLIGYAALYGQAIIHASAHGDDRGPQWPEMEGLRTACFQFLGTCFVSFLPLLAVVFFVDHEEGWVLPASIVAGLFGVTYLPMALMSVAMFDSITAVNPVVVLPAIKRIPLPYLTTVVLFSLLVGLSRGLELLLNFVIPIPFVPIVVMSIFSTYLFTVEMRLLGVMYRANRHDIGWFE